MDVRLPNGTVIKNVPENATKDQVMQKAISAGLASPEDFGIKQEAQKSPDENAIKSGFLMGVKDPINAGAQLLPRGLEQVTSGFGAFPNVVSKFFADEVARVDKMVKQEEEQYQLARQQQGEEGFDFTRLAGNIVSPASLAPVYRAASMVTNPLAKSVVSGAVGGALQPVTSGEFGEEKAKQVAIGGALAPVGEKVLKTAGNIANPIISKAEQTLNDLGVSLTPGQLAGKGAEQLEELVKALPLVGNKVADAREKALFDYNKGIINKTLEKIGSKLPETEGGFIGRDALAFTKQELTKAYDDVLGKVNFELDPTFRKAMNKSTDLVTSASDKQRLSDEINKLILSRLPLVEGQTASNILDAAGKPIMQRDMFSKKFDGQTYKKIESDLYKRIKDYTKETSSASEKDIGRALQEVLDSMKESLYRQNPSQVPALRKVDSAYGDFKVMKDAASYINAEKGVFTPGNLKAASKKSDKTKSKFYKGEARLQEFAEAGEEVLGSSGGVTERNFASPLGLLSTGSAIAAGAVSPGGLAAFSTIVPAMYTDTGLKTLNYVLRTRPELLKKIGEGLQKRANKEGSITGAMVAKEYNRLARETDKEEK